MRSAERVRSSMKLQCINCTNECRLTAEESGGEIAVEGNGCEKGAEYAISEIKDPRRSLTTTVRTTAPGIPVLPVRTDGEIPKGKIMEAMRALSEVIISGDLEMGDTVVEDLAGSGVRVICTSDALRRVASEAEVRNAKSKPGGGGAQGPGSGMWSARPRTAGAGGEADGEDGASADGSASDPEEGEKESAGDGESSPKPAGAGYKPSRGKAHI